MDFQDLCGFFGGSIFYEDLRSDLAQVEARIQREREALATASRSQKARLMLIEAVYSLLIGEFINAETLLVGLERGSFGSRWMYRARIYKLLAHIWQLRPPLLFACSVEEAIGLDAHKAKDVSSYQIHLEYCSGHLQDVSDIDKHEFTFIHNLWLISHVFYDQVQAITTDSLPDLDSIVDLTSRRKTELNELYEVLPSLGIPFITVTVDLLLFRLSSSQGLLQEESYYLERMRQTCERSADSHGLALNYLLRGDAMISSAATSPSVLNFDIADHFMEFDEYNLPFVADACHFQRFALEPKEGENCDLKSPASRAAHACYEIAISQFRHVGSRRGMATALFRQACLIRMEDLCVVRVCNDLNHNNINKNVEALLVSAQKLFEETFDIQSLRLVQTHLMLQIWSSTNERAELGVQIGRWAKRSGSVVFGYRLATFSLRLGHYYRYQCGSAILASSSYDFARQITKGLPSLRSTWAVVMLEQASVYTELGDWRAAKIWNGWITTVIKPVLAEFTGILAHNDLSSTEFERRSLKSRLFLQRILDFAIDVNSQIDVVFESPTGISTSFPDNWTSEKMKEIRNIMFQTPSAEIWLSHVSIKIEYLVAVARWKNCIKHGDDAGASLALLAFSAQHGYKSDREERISQDDRLYWHNKSNGSSSWTKPSLQDVAKLEYYESIDLRVLGYLLDIACKLNNREAQDEMFQAMSDTRLIPPECDEILLSSNKLLDRYTHQRGLESLELIFDCSIKIRNWKSASRLLEKIEILSPGYFTSVTSFTKKWPWQRCLNAGLVFDGLKRYNLAILYYEQSLEFKRRKLADVPLLDTRRSILDHPGVVRLGTAIARISIMWGNDEQRPSNIAKYLHSPEINRVDSTVFTVFRNFADRSQGSEHYLHGLLILESLRGQFITETLVSTERNPAVAKAKYKLAVWGELVSKSVKTSEEQLEFEKLSEINRDLEMFIIHTADRQNIGQNSGKLDSDKMRKGISCIPNGSLVVYTSLSEDGLAIYGIDNTGVQIANFDSNSTGSYLIGVVLKYLGKIASSKGKKYQTEIGAMSTMLSELLLLPVQDLIEKSRHIIFVPSGVLSRIPFGALTYLGHPLIMQKDVSQVPSLNTLLHIQTRHPTSSIATTRNISIIARPGSVRESRDGGPKSLPFAGMEALLLGCVYNTLPKNAVDVSREDFRNILRESNIVHISTHGQIDQSMPSLSHILMKDLFRIVDISNLRTSLDLVIFSACLTGVGDARDGGDMLGFSHAILATGAACYVGALWKADDIATTLHMMLFHVLIRRNTRGDTLAHLWQQATKLLYESTRDSMLRMVEEWVTIWRHLETIKQHPESFIQGGQKKLEKLIRMLESPGTEEEGLCDFRHPYYWAPFVMVGAADLVVCGKPFMRGLEDFKGIPRESGAGK